MSTEFEQDRSHALEEMRRAREELLRVVGQLDDTSLDAGRRGGWSVRQVLDHIRAGEWHYVRGVRQLRDLPGAQPDPDGVTTWESVAPALERSRAALLEAVDGVDEDAFYDVKVVLGQDYSVLSILQNVGQHDREHTAQVVSLLEG